MSVFDQTTCGTGTLCHLVKSWTGNESLARASNWLIAKPLAIIGLIIVAAVTRWILHRLIDRVAQRAAAGLPTMVLHNRVGGAGETRLGTATVASRRVQRAKTMGSLLKSITSIVIITITGIMAISVLGYPVGPLIASAGIVGVALGFGAQSLVKDFLSGIFMIFEDQYGVGDVVDAGSASGTVEAVGLRVTRIRDVQGTVWYVRNGEIVRIGNMSQNWARTVLDVPVPHDADLRRVQEVLREVAQSIWDDEDFNKMVIEQPEVWGVQDITPDSILVRVVMKTAPLEQWAVAREMRERIKARFDMEGMEIARPPRIVWHREAPSPSGNGTGVDGKDRAGVTENG
ncbi:MAG TPA: mechanosensitive ion channel family protein [Nocardioidaceae bacterium]|nr:mechanosensitive ion channel family protein [Nocardioidaceae bacterium]